MRKPYLLPLYDVVSRLFGLRPIHQRMVTLAGLSAGQRVLDVGCGTGNLLRVTARAHPGVDLTGLDPDPRMLARARRKTTARLDRGFAQELPYADGEFDVVFSSLMLHHLDDTGGNEMLAEVLRVLRPDGVLVLADIVNHGHDHGHVHRMAPNNIGDAVTRRIAAAGFTVAPTVVMSMRRHGRVGIEVARPAQA
jgi:ubiquinone/menaquinone biosynthesis C-methylase UbiE